MYKHCDQLKYKRDREYKLAIHLLAALAYLPHEEIESNFEDIEDNFDETLGDFLEYFVYIKCLFSSNWLKLI